jgi:lipopolysaccharide export LptBFGC system permease protein LptF
MVFGCTMTLLILIIILFLLAWFRHTKDLIIAKQIYAKQLEQFQSQLIKMTDLKNEYYNRTVEIENGVREGTAISLRNEVTQVLCDFDSIELTQMSEGLKLLIQVNYDNISDVEYLIKLIKKVNEGISAHVKSKSEKEVGID